MMPHKNLAICRVKIAINTFLQVQFLGGKSYEPEGLTKVLKWIRYLKSANYNLSSKQPQWVYSYFLITLLKQQMTVIAVIYQLTC